MEFPEDLGYTSDHEWVKEGNDSVVRVGITQYAAQEMGDIVFVSLPQIGDHVDAHDSVAELESTKSVSEVFSPVTGEVTAINEMLADSPELVGTDPYGDGWLFDVEISEPAELDDLMDATAYSSQVG